MRTQLKVVDFQNGQGIRFVARYTQGAIPVINPEIFYSYQGLTDDGAYYVAAFFPVYVSTLPDEVEVEDWEVFNQSYSQYLQLTIQDLGTMSADEFEPDLSRLDMLIESLEVESVATFGALPATRNITELPVSPASSWNGQMPVHSG